MSTLTLKSKTIVSQPLEDWYEELIDETTDPLNLLIAEEEAEEEPTIINKEETTMSATQVNNTPAFDVNSWLNTLSVLTETTVPAYTVSKPDWLEIKGPLTPDNAFSITAGVVKAARRITDGLLIAKKRHNNAIERLHIQEARSLRETGEKTFGPAMTELGIHLSQLASGRANAPGFNPDGQEFDLAIKELETEIEELENVIANGSSMLETLFAWIDEYATQLGLTVEVGHTIEKDLIGNTFRRPKMEPLNNHTLMIGIQRQKEFIGQSRNQRMQSQDVMDRMGR